MSAWRSSIVHYVATELAIAERAVDLFLEEQIHHILSESRPDSVARICFSKNKCAGILVLLKLDQLLALAREIYEANPDFNLSDLEDYLHVSKSTAGAYVSDIRARRKEAQKTVAYRLHRLGWTSEEIGRTTIMNASAIRNLVSEFPDLENQTKKLLTDGIHYTRDFFAPFYGVGKWCNNISTSISRVGKFCQKTPDVDGGVNLRVAFHNTYTPYYRHILIAFR